jgi:putative colanic acid biosynthesis acetyltransferase WcaF
MIVHSQKTPFSSPWTITQRIKMLIWEYAWALLCSWTPKPANAWRIFTLKLFGAKIYGKPFVHQRARIQIPWNLTLHDRAAIGDRTVIYSLGKITVHESAIVSQEVYVCTGTHSFESPQKNLITAAIVIGANSFIGARAFILPGITIGANAVVGACSVVTKNVDAGEIVRGNPATVSTRKEKLATAYE